MRAALAQLSRAGAAGAGLAAALAGGAQAACLPYEPAQVTLAGRLAAEGGGERAALRLKLDRPICTSPGSGAPGESRVRELKLAFGRQPPPARLWAGRRVAVSGSLYRGARGGRVEVTLIVTGLGRMR